MPKNEAPAGAEHFISSEIRPKVTPDYDKHPPLGPNSSKEELRKRAYDVIGEPDDKTGFSPFPSNPWGLSFEKSSSTHWATLNDALNGEAVILNLKNSRYYNLNRVGTAIWELLDGDKTLAAVLPALLQRYEVEESNARNDLIAFVTRLYEEELIFDKGG